MRDTSFERQKDRQADSQSERISPERALLEWWPFLTLKQRVVLCILAGVALLAFIAPSFSFLRFQTRRRPLVAASCQKRSERNGNDRDRYREEVGEVREREFMVAPRASWAKFLHKKRQNFTCFH